MLDKNEVISVLEPVVKVFNELGITYYIGGSVASSIYGFARATRDIDVVSNLQLSHVSLLVDRLKSLFFIDGDMILDAIRRKSSFNLIHLETAMKVDVFVLKEEPFARNAFDRRREDSLGDDKNSIRVYLCPAEDIILAKLEWYKEGNQISERQWLDVLGVIKVQYNTLDLDYLKKWAYELNVLDLLEKAFVDGKL